MIHYLPSIASDQAGYESLAELAKATSKLRKDRLELDFSGVAAFDANMAAPLGAVLARVADRFNGVEIVNLPEVVERILRKNDFLTHYQYPPLEGPAQTSLPFLRLQRTDEVAFEVYLQQHLKGKGLPQMSEGLGKVFKQKIYEVFQNAIIHSESDLGIFVCGQFFPQKQRLDLTIADAGIGIRDSVRKFFDDPKIPSVPAIRWAMQKGHTTKKGKQPGGLGLKFLHDFVRLNKGRIHIVSRFGFYEFNGRDEVFAKMTGDYHGTVVTIVVNTADTSAYQLASEVSSESIF